jgi:hypothetical protein
MVFLRNKRGGLKKNIYFMTFEVIVLGLILLYMVMKVNSAVDATSYWKKYYAKDNALLIEALHGAPGDVDFSYEINYDRHLLELEFMKSRVNVYDFKEVVEGQRRLPESFLFGKSEYINVVPTNLILRQYYFSKSPSNIMINRSAAIIEDCPQTPIIESLKDHKIYFDSGEGFENDAYTEEEVMESVVEDAKQFLRLHFRAEYGDNQNYYQNNIEGATEGNADVIVSVNMNDQEENILIIYYPKNSEEDKGEKLACILKEKITDALPYYFTSTKVEVISSFDSDTSIINNNKVSVYLELGSIKSYDYNINSQRAKLGRAIFESLIAYYG